MQPVPDRGVVAQLQQIDRDLSVEWMATPSGPRWAIFHALQLPGRPDEVVDQTAAEVQRVAALHGHLLDRSECAFAAAQALKDAQLVCYVTEDDGSYRPLDGRIVEKIRRMDFNRRNLGLKDWTALVKAKADVARERRLREEGDVWDVVRRDKVLGRVLSDILWGQRPVRSVYIRKESDDGGAQLRPEAGAGAATDPAADDHGEGRDALATAERDSPAAGTSHAA